MKGNRPKIHGNSPKNGQKMKQKHIKNALFRVKFWSTLIPQHFDLTLFISS